MISLVMASGDMWLELGDWKFEVYIVDKKN